MNHEPLTPVTEFTGFPPSGHMNCPQCDYSLSGLPSEHICPECGLPFDNDTHVWVRTFTKRHRVTMICVIAFNCIYPLGVWTYLLLTGFTRNPWLFLGSLVNVAMAVWLIHGLRNWPRRPPLVALVRDAIIYHFSNFAPRRIELSDIIRIKPRRIAFGATTALKLHRVPRRINVGWFTNLNEADRFQALVESRRDALSPAVSPPAIATP